MKHVSQFISVISVCYLLFVFQPEMVPFSKPWASDDN